MIYFVLSVGYLFAFSLFSLAMPKHRNQLGLSPINSAKEQLLKTAAWLVLTLLVSISIIMHGVAIGLLSNLSVMSLSALAVAVFYSLQKKSRRMNKV